MRGAGFPFSWLDEVVTRSDVSAALREVARNESFREAVTWQNRSAVEDGLDSLLRKPEGATDSKTRKKELLVVRYLQRYCAKNDTIGFFGPVGWASWGRKGRFIPQRELLTARRAFAEPWMARVLADTLAVDPSLRDKALVWLPGDLRVERKTLITPSATHALSAEEAKLLLLLQEKGPLKASRLRKHRALLERLAAQDIIRWSFPVAISHDPLKALPAAPAIDAVRACLAALQSPHPDARPLGGEGGRLAKLEDAFVAATQHAPKRHEGRTYGGRGLVYEECRRAVDLELSDAMRARVQGPLSVVLDIARWYTFQIASGLTRRLQQRFARAKSRRIPLHVFWADTASLFEGETPSVIAPVVKRLRATWNAMWGARNSLSVEEAQKFVSRRFSAPGPGWPGARHHAPDLMWAAPDAEAMLRGEGTPILGELHPGVTPFTTLSVLAHADDRRSLERQWHQDFGDDQITPIPWEDFARSSQDARLAKKHWHLDIGFGFESDRPAQRVLRAADFDVMLVRKRLVAVHRTRPLRFDLIALFERRLKMLAATSFSLGDGKPDGPRRTLGGMVVQRAHWRFPREALAFLEETEGRAERVQAFCAAHSLPRRVFVRSPEEVKPVYVDWSAPILVEMLTRLSRQAEWLSFSEMLPGPGELWLKDAAGAAFVCELRCIAVDPHRWNALAARVPARRKPGSAAPTDIYVVGARGSIFYQGP